MRLSELIDLALNEIEEARNKNVNKQNYLVQELEFEVFIEERQEVGGRANIYVVNLGGERENTNSNKITLKLKPRNN